MCEREQDIEVFAVEVTPDEARDIGFRAVRVFVPRLVPLSFRHAARYLGHPRVVDAHERLDEQAFAAGTAWSAVVLTPTGVRLGPVVVPGKSACYECFLRRSTQHDKYPRRTAAVWRAAADQPIDGWLPSDLLVGTGFVEKLLGDADRDWPAGAVVEYQGTTGDLHTHTVIGVHGCAWCRPVRDRAADTWQDLRNELADLAVGAR